MQATKVNFKIEKDWEGVLWYIKMEEFMRENGITTYATVEGMNGFKMGTFIKETI